MTSQPSTQDDAANPEQDHPHSDAVKSAAQNLRTLADEHGGLLSVHIEYVTFDRTRVVIVAKDGRWGDAVLPSYDAAQQVAETNGWEVEPEGDWSREAVASVKTTGFEWGRMGSGRASGE